MMMLVLALGMAGAGHARNEGVTDTEIHLGASVVLSGPLGPQTVGQGGGRVGRQAGGLEEIGHAIVL